MTNIQTPQDLLKSLANRLIRSSDTYDEIVTLSVATSTIEYGSSVGEFITVPAKLIDVFLELGRLKSGKFGSDVTTFKVVDLWNCAILTGMFESIDTLLIELDLVKHLADTYIAQYLLLHADCISGSIDHLVDDYGDPVSLTLTSSEEHGLTLMALGGGAFELYRFAEVFIVSKTLIKLLSMITGNEGIEYNSQLISTIQRRLVIGEVLQDLA